MYTRAAARHRNRIIILYCIYSIYVYLYMLSTNKGFYYSAAVSVHLLYTLYICDMYTSAVVTSNPRGDRYITMIPRHDPPKCIYRCRNYI